MACVSRPLPQVARQAACLTPYMCPTRCLAACLTVCVWLRRLQLNPQMVEAWAREWQVVGAQNATLLDAAQKLHVQVFSSAPLLEVRQPQHLVTLVCPRK